ncbi:MAG TPA: hypothetical protein V6D28_26130 [Leptolyngbyaceae cyanobacterium]
MLSLPNPLSQDMKNTKKEEDEDRGVVNSDWGENWKQDRRQAFLGIEPRSPRIWNAGHHLGAINLAQFLAVIQNNTFM